MFWTPAFAGVTHAVTFFREHQNRRFGISSIREQIRTARKHHWSWTAVTIWPEVMSFCVCCISKMCRMSRTILEPEEDRFGYANRPPPKGFSPLLYFERVGRSGVGSKRSSKPAVGMVIAVAVTSPPGCTCASGGGKRLVL